MIQFTARAIAFRIWVNCVLVCALVIILAIGYESMLAFGLIFMAGLVISVFSLPGLLAVWIALPVIRAFSYTTGQKMRLTGLLMLLIALGYFVVLAFFTGLSYQYQPSPMVLAVAGSPPLGIVVAFLVNRKYLSVYYKRSSIHQNQTGQSMEQFPSQSPEEAQQAPYANSPLTKGLITGGLILLLLIPTFFISNLVNERQARQLQVVNEVSDKWAKAQTVSGPYLFIPYQHRYENGSGKTVTEKKHLLLLPDELSISGDIIPEQRLRSIYKVLLYRSNLSTYGTINLSLPKDIDPASLLLSDAKVCIGISDFKGIEKKIRIELNGKRYDLLPGLPTNEIDATGLSANIDLGTGTIGATVAFKSDLQLKGSSYLHLMPLAGNSHFQLRSSWPDPSFDGALLPAERSVSKHGFTAKWEFSKANLPFGTQLQDAKIDRSSIAFGVSMLQTADQYAKTSRSVKYAILIIGLSFSLFFIIEIMQKKPMHPVQYVLTGLAMVIFYSLLLSISEFISFDYAYLVAASATILLISLYTHAHFRSRKTASVFGMALTALYGFIFVLIRLEDTALLIGTISLFAILAAVMYATRKIRWYHSSVTAG